MAYDEELAQRLREFLEEESGVTEKKMFGGLAFMVSGNMLCGIVGGDLMVRVGPQHYQEALELAHTRPMDFTGRPMKGIVYVDADGCKTDSALRSWINRGLGFAGSLPPKTAGRTKKRNSRRIL
ncbi:MAG: TfoX family protein [Dehalococcoidia bacterium]|nr:TfoX family protein [Dehalococcoidia bacterium]